MKRAGVGLLLLLWAVSGAVAQVLSIDVVARQVTDGAVVRIDFDNVSLAALDKNRLTIVYRELDFKIPLDSLSKIKVVRRSGFLDGSKRGAIIGAAAGVVIGGAVGWDSADSGEKFKGAAVSGLGWGAVFGVVGGIVGGIIRQATGKKRTTYDFRKMDRNEQIETINKLLEETAGQKSP